MGCKVGLRRLVFLSFCKAVFFEKWFALAFDAFACLVRLFV